MIPNQVKVAGIEYNVTEIEGINDRFNTLGQINYHIGLIELDSQLNQTRKEQVFVHEILHACFFEAGYEEQDEDMINRVGIVLYQVLKDNNLTFE
ncbi:ImmA/IrrE family metallo-endopeptidase [Ornithinibacillus bavariensis]|uniref:ImmA/IrrE family metallo-endopeptidase n=1 Tax=Ornithinibacillus bavariensis TaxID=545502 RepID=UPI000EBAC2FE|nr:ImmA/IrrE family metallo-endopeptidase [Ornithinibacillus sp.]